MWRPVDDQQTAGLAVNAQFLAQPASGSMSRALVGFDIAAGDVPPVLVRGPEP